MCFYTHTRVLQCPWSMGKPGKGNGCPHCVANSFAMGFFSETGACSLSYVSKSWWPSCFCPTSQAQCRYDAMPGFTHQCWHLNSGPHIFVTNTPAHWCLPNLTSMSLAILKLSLGIGPGLYSSRAVFTHLRPLFSGFLFWCLWTLCSLWLFWILLSWNYAIYIFPLYQIQKVIVATYKILNFGKENRSWCCYVCCLLWSWMSQWRHLCCPFGSTLWGSTLSSNSRSFLLSFFLFLPLPFFCLLSSLACVFIKVCLHL